MASRNKKPRHSCAGIADCGSQRAFARYVRQLGAQPQLEAIEDRFGLGLPDLDPFVGRQSPGCFLDCIELGDPPDGFVGDGGPLGFVHINELAAHMGHAGDLADIAGSVDILKTGITISVHPDHPTR